MPLPTPILDDRTFEQLRSELVARIPAFTPEWTDHNESDPGIVLLELLAFLGENLLYRFNQIPEATRIAFLKLLQLPLRPGTSARALVTLATKPSQVAGVLVPRGTAASAGDVAFELQDEVHAWPATATAFARMPEAAPAPGSEAELFAQRTRAALEQLGLAAKPAYYSLVPVSETGDAVDFGASIDGTIWVAVIAAKQAPLAELRRELEGKTITLGFVPDQLLDADQANEYLLAAELPIKPATEWSVTARRELPAPGGTANAAAIAAAVNGGAWLSAMVVADSTAGLTREGALQLELPRGTGRIELGDPDLAGVGGLPPALPDPDEAERLLFWLRGTRDGQAPFGRVKSIALNAARALNVRSAPLELLGVGSGDAGQRYRLVNKPVVARSLRLQVEGPEGWSDWLEVDDFHASSPRDRHYVVDAEAGEVRFGDSLRGDVPAPGRQIRVLEYRYGGGARGNVPAKAISRIDVQGVRIENPFRALGGSDPESVPHALERIPLEIRRRDRAVTAEDFRTLAAETPGWAVGRAECLAHFDPSTRAERDGAVAVIVWPSDDAEHPDAPLPSKELRESVRQYLDERRLVTTRLRVVPPRYKRVSVTVGVQTKNGASFEAVRRWVDLAVRQYLAPLPPYGPDGGGWPLGRKVIAGELAAVALQVDGVQYLDGKGVRLATPGANGEPVEALEQEVSLAPEEVVEVVSIAVTRGPAGDPSSTQPPLPPISGDGSGSGGGEPLQPLPFPTVPEAC